MARVQNKSTPILDDLVILIEEGEFKTDDNGNDVTEKNENEVFCAEASIYQSEFHQAGQQGIQPKACLVVHTNEYNGERTVRFYDSEMYVYRTYPRADGLTELYLTKRVSNNDY